jgi:hypothetical protein
MGNQIFHSARKLLKSLEAQYHASIGGCRGGSLKLFYKIPAQR